MDSFDRRFNDLMTDVFDGLRDYYPDIINDEGNREPLMEVARSVYDSRSEDDFRRCSDYEALRDAVEAAVDQVDPAPAF